jgi:hypothetical protein
MSSGRCDGRARTFASSLDMCATRWRIRCTTTVHVTTFMEFDRCDFAVDHCCRMSKALTWRGSLTLHRLDRFICGFFNGDPHPGNILVTKAEAVIDFERTHGSGGDAVLPARAAFVETVKGMDWVPVLIDFGLTKELGTPVRLALAKMVVSAELLDYGGLLDSHLVRARLVNPVHEKL